MQTFQIMIDYIAARTDDEYIYIKDKLIEVVAHTESQAVDMVKGDLEGQRPRYIGMWYKVTAA